MVGWLGNWKKQRGNVDSKSRYIYIHGTAEEGLIGEPNLRLHKNEEYERYKVIQ